VRCNFRDKSDSRITTARISSEVRGILASRGDGVSSDSPDNAPDRAISPRTPVASSQSRSDHRLPPSWPSRYERLTSRVRFLVAHFVLAQQDDAGGSASIRFGALGRRFIDQQVDADDRFSLRRSERAIKLHHREQVLWSVNATAGMPASATASIRPSYRALPCFIRLARNANNAVRPASIRYANGGGTRTCLP